MSLSVALGRPARLPWHHHGKRWFRGPTFRIAGEMLTLAGGEGGG